MLSRLLALYQRVARLLRREMADKLRSGRGVDGRVLPAKIHPNGRPLGYARRATGLPGVLERGTVAATQEGFTIAYADAHLSYFHWGTRRQVARPVVGLSKAQVGRVLQGVIGEMQREAGRLGIGVKTR